MRRSSGARLFTSADNYQRSAQQCSSRSRAPRKTSVNAGYLCREPVKPRTFLRKPRAKGANYSNFDNHPESSSSLKIGSTPYSHKGSSFSTRLPMTGIGKFCTRVLLPLTLFSALMLVISVLWVPSHRTRRPYSSLEDDSYISASSISPKEDEKIGEGLNSSDSDSASFTDVKDQKRRMIAPVSNKTQKRTESWLSFPRCYDTGGRTLCSQANACTKYSLLCKCSCS